MYKSKLGIRTLWLVACGLTSRSAIFQLYSDGTDIKFTNFDLLPGTQRHGQLGSLACRAYSDTGTGTSENVFYLLATRKGPRAVRVSRESNPDRPIHSPARNLYATAAGTNTLNLVSTESALMNSLSPMVQSKMSIIKVDTNHRQDFVQQNIDIWTMDCENGAYSSLPGHEIS